MKRVISITAAVFGILMCCISGASAVPLRCMGADISTMTAADLAELKSEFNPDCVRVQFGWNDSMDGLSGAAYTAKLNSELEVFKAANQLLKAQGIGVIFSFYSPPGGFNSRKTPASHAMYSDPALIIEFYQAWQTIMEEIGNDSNILAFDVNNEPAMRKSLLCNQCSTWTEVLSQTIALIRTFNPSVPIIAKPLYASPSRLRSLDIYEDPNVYYGYHAYPYLGYQQSGVYGRPTGKKRPSQKKLWNKMARSLAKFLRKFKKYKGSKPAKAPLAMTESTVSSRAEDSPAQFLDDMVSFLEEDYLNQQPPAKRKCRKKKNDKKRMNCLKNAAAWKLVRNYSESKVWSWHTLFEKGLSEVWDPRFVPNGSDFTYVGYTTDRAKALDKYFSR